MPGRDRQAIDARSDRLFRGRHYVSHIRQCIIYHPMKLTIVNEIVILRSFGRLRRRRRLDATRQTSADERFSVRSRRDCPSPMSRMESVRFVTSPPCRQRRDEAIPNPKPPPLAGEFRFSLLPNDELITQAKIIAQQATEEADDSPDYQAIP